MPDLAIIVPTRGRPENVRKVIAAWDFTNAWDVADLVIAIDEDDPAYRGYLDVQTEFWNHGEDEAPNAFQIMSYPSWLPMVHKLDKTAVALADRYFALGFAGDDHLPRTIDWAKSYLANLRGLRSGMVYSDDGYQGENLSSEWAMTSDVVRAWGRMVPAPVEHMYSDVSLLEAMREAGAVRYLDEIRIEHMHPIVGKAENDDQYRRVNHRDQMGKDRRIYERWQTKAKAEDVAAVRALWPERPMPVAKAPRQPRRAAVAERRPRASWTTGPARSGPRTVKGPERSMIKSKMIPKYLRNIVQLTPPEVAITLADLARQVPRSQAIVELGVYQGFTAFMMAWGARQGGGAHVWGFDPWDSEGNVYGPEFNLTSAKHNARYNVMGTGHASDVKLAQAFSVDAARDWGGPPVGLLYVDGDHTYQGCRQDIEAWAQHLVPGAVIAVDDYIEGDTDYEGLIRAVQDLVEAGVLEPIEVFHNRLAVTKLREEAKPIMVNDTSKVIGRTETVDTILGAPVTVQDNGTVMVENSITSHGGAPIDPPAEVDRLVVAEGELDGIPAGSEVAKLNLVSLKALSKARGIVLGKRKDKRSEIIAALRDGV